MEKISWTDKVTNEDVLRKVNEDKKILNDMATEISLDGSSFETRWPTSNKNLQKEELWVSRHEDGDDY